MTVSCCDALDADTYQNLKVTPLLVSLLTFKAFNTPCSCTVIVCLKQSCCTLMTATRCTAAAPVLCAFVQTVQSHRTLLDWVSSPTSSATHLPVCIPLLCFDIARTFRRASTYTTHQSRHSICHLTEPCEREHPLAAACASSQVLQSVCNLNDRFCGGPCGLGSITCHLIEALKNEFVAVSPRALWTGGGGLSLSARDRHSRSQHAQQHASLADAANLRLIRPSRRLSAAQTATPQPCPPWMARADRPARPCRLCCMSSVTSCKRRTRTRHRPRRTRTLRLWPPGCALCY